MTFASGQTALIIGGSSGIGQGLAQKFAECTSPSFEKVIITGRSESSIAEAASAHPKLSGVAFDPNDLSAIPSFVEKMVAEGVTYVWVNAGMMRGADFSNAESVDLDAIDSEIHVNLLSPIHLAKYLIKAFNETKTKATIVFTTSGLALVPLVRSPAYSASKAGLRAFLLAIREQLLAKGDSNFVSIVELLPPAVQTGLFDEDKQPDLKGKPAPPRTPLPEYVEAVFPRMVDGQSEEIGYGFSQNNLETIGKAQRKVLDVMQGRGQK